MEIRFACDNGSVAKDSVFFFFFFEGEIEIFTHSNELNVHMKQVIGIVWVLVINEEPKKTHIRLCACVEI